MKLLRIPGHTKLIDDHNEAAASGHQRCSISPANRRTFRRGPRGSCQKILPMKLRANSNEDYNEADHEVSTEATHDTEDKAAGKIHNEAAEGAANAVHTTAADKVEDEAAGEV